MNNTKNVKKSQLDKLDEEILAILAEDSRRSVTAIAEELDVATSMVRRRIARLERDVIEKFTIFRKHDDSVVEALVEMSFEGEADVPQILERAVGRKEVREASTIAGAPDAVLRLRVDSLDDLATVVTELRKEMGERRPGWRVTSSKTLVILDRHRHAHRRAGKGG